jgi:hypothetical protein
MEVGVDSRGVGSEKTRGPTKIDAGMAFSEFCRQAAVRLLRQALLQHATRYNINILVSAF